MSVGLIFKIAARYEYGKYYQDKAWKDMTDEERMDLVKKMRDQAKTLILCDMARKKKEAGEL